MPNPFNQPNISQFQQLYYTLTHSSNPMQIFENMAKNNPNLKPVMDILNKRTNPQQLYYEMCKQRGIDPQQFLKSITG